MSSCPFHKMLRHLKVFAGLPVPDSVRWIDEKPDFRQVDPEKLLRAVQYELCGVCGKKLGLSSFWIGGPLCLRNHCFQDAAMHRECAVESIRLCPFLNGKRAVYRGDLPDQGAMKKDGRPERMFLMRGVTSEITLRQVGRSTLIYAGLKLHVEREF